jgi:hypothetical protein
MIFLSGGIGKPFLLLFSSRLSSQQLLHSQIFPSYSSARRPVCKNSALARIKEKRLEQRTIADAR